MESCKEGEQERLGEHCYYWSTRKGTWHSSKQDCESLNGSLAAITSIEIHNVLMTKVDKENRLTWYYIDGSDVEKEGVSCSSEKKKDFGNLLLGFGIFCPEVNRPFGENGQKNVGHIFGQILGLGAVHKRRNHFWGYQAPPPPVCVNCEED